MSQLFFSFLSTSNAASYEHQFSLAEPKILRLVCQAMVSVESLLGLDSLEENQLSHAEVSSHKIFSFLQKNLKSFSEPLQGKFKVLYREQLNLTMNLHIDLMDVIINVTQSRRKSHFSN